MKSSQVETRKILINIYVSMSFKNFKNNAARNLQYCSKKIHPKKYLTNIIIKKTPKKINKSSQKPNSVQRCFKNQQLFVFRVKTFVQLKTQN